MTSAGTDPAGGHLLQRHDHLDKTSVDGIAENGALVREVVINRGPVDPGLLAMASIVVPLRPYLFNTGSAVSAIFSLLALHDARSSR